MFTHWEVNRANLASRVLFQRPAHYVPETILRQHVQERVFPDRRLRRKTPETDRVAFQAKCNELRLLAAGAERVTRSPSRLGTAGMTLSEQTNNTTLNILHGVRRSDPPLPPPLPSFLFRLPLPPVPSSFGRHSVFCSHLLRCCGGLFACLCGVLSPRGPPFMIW